MRIKRVEAVMDFSGFTILLVGAAVLSSPFWIIYLNRKKKFLGYAIAAAIVLYFLVGYIITLLTD